MKHFVIMLIFVSVAGVMKLGAQEVIRDDRISKMNNQTATMEMVADDEAVLEPLEGNYDNCQTNCTDDTLNFAGLGTSTFNKPYLFTVWSPVSPFGIGGLWDIHEGLNLSIDAGVTVGFGKDNPFRGASFFTNLSMLYAKKVDQHWTWALGGTLSQFNMFNTDIYTGTLYGMANYAFNEKISATIYGSYTYSPNNGWTRPQALPFVNRCAEIGAEFTYKFNDSFSMSISVSESAFDTPSNVSTRLTDDMKSGKRQ